MASVRNTLKEYFKAKVIKYLNHKGLTIVTFDSREVQLEKVRNDWLTKNNINSIIDVGASDGGFATKARKLFQRAKIYSFEPIPSSYKILTKKFASDKNFKAFNIALGNTVGQSEFHLHEHVGASSFLRISDLHIDAHPYTKNCSEIKVALDKLDNLIKIEDLTPDILLKLDVQGYEIEVLKGSEELLKHTRYVYSEVCFNKLYEEQPLFDDIADFLRERGFHIAGVENIARSTKDGTFLNADVFFTRNF
ncbi:FkbM family methyltransferase [candidate division KSB1 bacterium]|nr:FkbM family methyltransferase [candidate division KSB1 bacterium]RQW11005.1 MAG: FkbM family methyltransferase [candidate division KSB1 bacterium]